MDLILTESSQAIMGSREFIHPFCVYNLASNPYREYATYKRQYVPALFVRKLLANSSLILVREGEDWSGVGTLAVLTQVGFLKGLSMPVEAGAAGG